MTKEAKYKIGEVVNVRYNGKMYKGEIVTDIYFSQGNFLNADKYVYKFEGIEKRPGVYSVNAPEFDIFPFLESDKKEVVNAYPLLDPTGQLYPRAYSAWNGTSFDPEKRRDSFFRDYEGDLENTYKEFLAVAQKHAQTTALPSLWNDYLSKYRDFASGWLSRKGNTLSTMIAGPSKFPTGRAEKANNALDGHFNKWTYWDDKAKARIKKELTGYVAPTSAAPDDELIRQQKKLANHEQLQERMKAINNAHRAYLKNPASLEKTDLSEVEKNIVKTYVSQYSWEPNPYAPYQLTNNNATIKRLKERVAELSVKAEAMNAPAINNELKFEGGYIEKNYSDNRLQIYFDGIPSAEIRTVLKSNGYKWSPKNKAWQRILTDNAFRSLYQIGKLIGLEEGQAEAFRVGTVTLDEPLKNDLKINSNQTLSDAVKAIRKFVRKEWPQYAKLVKVMEFSGSKNAENHYAYISVGLEPEGQYIKEWFYNIIPNATEDNLEQGGMGISINMSQLPAVLKAIEAHEPVIQRSEKSQKWIDDAKATGQAEFKYAIGDTVYYNHDKNGKVNCIVLSAYVENGEKRYIVYPAGKKLVVSYHIWVKEKELFARNTEVSNTPKFNFGDTVLYKGEVWQIGFVNLYTSGKFKGHYRLQKGPSAYDKQVNYVYEKDLVKTDLPLQQPKTYRPGTTEYQQTKNSIQEGFLTLRTGKFNSRTLGQDEYNALRKKVQDQQQLIGSTQALPNIPTKIEFGKTRAELVKAKLKLDYPQLFPSLSVSKYVQSYSGNENFVLIEKKDSELPQEIFDLADKLNVNGSDRPKGYAWLMHPAISLRYLETIFEPQQDNTPISLTDIFETEAEPDTEPENPLQQNLFKINRYNSVQAIENSQTQAKQLSLYDQVPLFSQQLEAESLMLELELLEI